ncbi:uncharacterized protein LACBIDRAFT_315798 [Laccaria bicolor S238N-H82]|uniref:Predicted protein n=1 Tax=Laccaria bicolor (strain S238N-H82 / ATCC MYA-4686) TaxID=486041 RepID=B0D376_LACBS|nr:uncharacterized protein LACBIDRAFT_315798 [Laccaria bicolor S238N-H82]EDR11232.1 predicted protein [Laccaria bicolor S238N-H82]|eukprot:XP_001878533.1 predicted protein [Laccaria bicolor S238N-H82]
MSSNPRKPFHIVSLPYLTKLAHGSAPFLATFLLIHLAAPAVANLGGSSLSSQTMLLGREYYQTSFGENFLLLSPLVVHSMSGIAKRLLSPKDQPPRPASSLLSISGYATLFLFLPIHYMTHRVNPTSDVPPIFAVGPSELDYEYVKMGLHTWPWRSWLLYGGLVGSATLHLADGMAVIWNTYLKRKLASSSRKTRLAVSLGVIALPVMMGIYALSQEPMMIFASTMERYKASFMSSTVYQI